VRFRQILAVCAFAFIQIGHGIDAETIKAHVHPEFDNIQHGLPHRRIIIVQVRLAAVEAMPVVFTGLLIIGPVGFFCIQKDDTRIAVWLTGGTPHIIITQGGILAAARFDKPGVLIGGVINDHIGDNPHPPAMDFVNRHPAMS
jgi:hypothetical protein